LPSRSYAWDSVRLPLLMLVGRLAASYPKVALPADQLRAPTRPSSRQAKVGTAVLRVLSGRSTEVSRSAQS
jgi:hypothetical protein